MFSKLEYHTLIFINYQLFYQLHTLEQTIFQFKVYDISVACNLKGIDLNLKSIKYLPNNEI